MRYWHLFLGIILIALLTGCGTNSSDNENVGLEAARDDNSQTITTNSSDSVDSDTPNNEINQFNLENTLVYITGFDLYLWDFTQPEPEKVDLMVDPDHVYVDPEQKYLVVGAASEGTFGLYKVDTATRNTSEIVQLSNYSFYPRWSILSWSPNGEWILINAANVGAPLGFVRADGSLESAIKIADDWRPTYWTNENKLVLLETEDQFRTAEHRFVQVEGVKILDPADDDAEDLTSQIDLDFINGAQDRNEQYERLVDALHSIDITFASFDSSATEVPTPRIAIQRPDDQAESNLYCNTWRIAEWDVNQGLSDEPTRILYEFEDTALLTHFTQLPDGSVLFIHGWYPDCQYGIPEGELIHMHTDGTYEVLSEDIMSAGDTSAFNGSLDSVRYLVAPNNNTVIWIYQGENGVPEEQTLYVTDLVSGETAELLINGEAIHSLEEILWIKS